MGALRAITRAALAALFIWGCAQKPTPFEAGDQRAPPVGCQELRERGGEC